MNTSSNEKLVVAVPSLDIRVDGSTISEETHGELLHEYVQVNTGEDPLDHKLSQLPVTNDLVLAALKEHSEGLEEPENKLLYMNRHADGMGSWKVTLDKTGRVVDFPYDPDYMSSMRGGNAHNWAENEDQWREVIALIDQSETHEKIDRIDTELLRYAFWISGGVKTADGEKDICLGEAFPMDPFEKFIERNDHIQGRHLILDAFPENGLHRHTEAMVVPSSKGKETFVTAMRTRDKTFACMNSAELKWLNISTDNLDLTDDNQLRGLIDEIIKREPYHHTSPRLILGLELGTHSISVHSYKGKRIVTRSVLDIDLSTELGKIVVPTEESNKAGRGDIRNAGKGMADVLHRNSGILSQYLNAPEVSNGTIFAEDIKNAVRACIIGNTLATGGSAIMQRSGQPNIAGLDPSNLAEVMHWCLSEEAQNNVHCFFYDPTTD